MLKLITQHTLFVHCLTYSVPLRECGIDCVTITIIIILSTGLCFVYIIVLRVNRNHAWVSFQGFAESYNDTFTLSKALWVTDGIWKLTFPHCMHRVKV